MVIIKGITTTTSSKTSDTGLALHCIFHLVCSPPWNFIYVFSWWSLWQLKAELVHVRIREGLASQSVSLGCRVLQL